MTLLTGAGMAPGEGLLVLEIQEKILNFLLQCASIIVHDLQITARLSVPLTLPPPSFNIPSEINWPSVTASVATAPYRVPAQFDFPRIKALINAKLAEAEDHIWSLREDPAYFRDFAWDCSQHRPENLPSINQKRHPLLGKPKFWDIVFDNIVADAYGNYLVWNLVQQKIIELAALRAHYGTRITPSSLLPVDYQKAIDHFFHLFKQFVENRCYISVLTFTRLRHYANVTFVAPLRNPTPLNSICIARIQIKKIIFCGCSNNL